MIHRCHLTSRDAFSWSSWSVCFGDVWLRNWDCWWTVLEWFLSWFFPTKLPGFFLICLRVSWMISEVRFSTIVKPSYTSELAQVLRNHNTYFWEGKRSLKVVFEAWQDQQPTTMHSHPYLQKPIRQMHSKKSNVEIKGKYAILTTTTKNSNIDINI